MTAETTAPADALSQRLCPWLREPLEQLEAARASGRLGHGWLLRGPPGIGKLNLALVFANRVLRRIDTTIEPPVLDAAAAAAAIKERHVPADHHPDLHRIFPEEDKKTIGIEQVRAVEESLALKAFQGGAKVVVVEPAEAMTPAAANALLKTLEEPQPDTYLLLVSHQPGRLLPTLRSRCQTVIVTPPPAEAVANWLGVAPASGRPSSTLLMFGRAPLRALEMASPEKAHFLNHLEDTVNRLSSGKIDPRALAEEWLRNDVELALQWLVRRLQQAIRRRVASRDPTKVTPRSADPLDNAWAFLPVEALFQRLQAAEKLLDQLGSGINVELALHVLLLGLQPNRGQG